MKTLRWDSDELDSKWKEKVEIEIVNIRDFTKDKYGRVDSAPIGGGAGLVMKCQPIVDCLKSVKSNQSHTILLSPRGKTYSQQKAHELLKNHKDITHIIELVEVYVVENLKKQH